MSKEQIVRNLKESFPELTLEKIENLVEAVFETVKEGVIEHGEVRIPRFGKFEIVERAERMGVNPQDPKKKIKIPARKTLVFRVSSVIKDEINQ